MVIVGVILLVTGYLAGLAFLFTVGLVLLVAAVALAFVGLMLLGVASVFHLRLVRMQGLWLVAVGAGWHHSAARRTRLRMLTWWALGGAGLTLALTMVGMVFADPTI
jgi:hypothetical protein